MNSTSTVMMTLPLNNNTRRAICVTTTRTPAIWYYTNILLLVVALIVRSSCRGRDYVSFVTSFSIRAPLTSVCKRSSRSSSSSRFMISNFLGGDNNNKDTNMKSSTLPKDVKGAVSKCRTSVQNALEKRMSRMEINFPVGTKFGVESKNTKKKSKKQTMAMIDADGDTALMPNKDEFDTSDRELALLFVDMFQAVGGDAISVVYRDATLAQIAKTRWKDDVGSECTVLSVDRKTKTGGGGSIGGGKKKKKAMGFAAKMAEEMGDDTSGGGNSGPFRLPDGCEVALFVAPGPKELIAAKRICEEVGMGTLVILLNARLRDYDSSTTNDDITNYFQDEFESIFHLSAAPQQDAPGCLLHRSYPDGWILARNVKVGSPKTFAAFEERPSGEECRVAYEGVEIGDLEQGVESALENVASWFS